MYARSEVSGIRVRWSLLIALALALVVPTAYAQTTHFNEKTPFAGEAFNPCVPETVAWEGFMHVNQKETVTPNGSQMTFNNRLSGQGVGNVTGLKYTYGQQMHFNGKVRNDGSGASNFRFREKVVSQGPTDNNFATAVIHCPGSGNICRVETIEMDCKG